MDDCNVCKFKRNVPGNCHIQCVNPDREMKGNPHGIANGWFLYPMLFDPTWKAATCNNFEELESK